MLTGKNAGPDEMAKISVLRAKMSKFRFVMVDLVMKDIKGRSFLNGAEEGLHRHFLTLYNENFLTPFTSKAGTDTDQHLRLTQKYLLLLIQKYLLQLMTKIYYY